MEKSRQCALIYSNSHPPHSLGKLFEWKKVRNLDSSVRHHARLPTRWGNYLNGKSSICTIAGTEEASPLAGEII